MQSLFRTLLALGLGLSPLVVTQLLSAPTTSAQGSTPPAALIVLDASGSVAAPGPGGTRLIDQARGAVSSTVSALPAGAQVGLRVYGSQVSSDAAQKVPGCQDSKLAKGATAHSSPSYAVGDPAAKYSSIAEAGKYFVTVNLKQDISCTGKVPISDAEYPIRIMANVAPFVAKTSATPTPSASPTATEAAPPTADSGTSPWVWVGIGVVVLGAAVIAMLVVLTKRNRAGRTAPSNPRF